MKKLLTLILAVLVLAGCSSVPKPPSCDVSYASYNTKSSLSFGLASNGYNTRVPCHTPRPINRY